MRTRELERLRKLLVKIKNEVDNEMGRFENKTLHQNRKESTGEVSSFTTHPADMGAETAEFEKAYILASKENNLLALIEGALARFEKGTYGQCVECGCNIPIERLMAIPYASCCVGCEEALEHDDYINGGVRKR